MSCIDGDCGYCEECFEVLSKQPLIDEIERLTAENAALVAERDRLAVQLAGCGVAASGWAGDKPPVAGDYGWSAAFGDVLRIRRELEALRVALEYVGANGGIILNGPDEGDVEHICNCCHSRWLHKQPAACVVDCLVAKAIALRVDK